MLPGRRARFSTLLEAPHCKQVNSRVVPISPRSCVQRRGEPKPPSSRYKAVINQTLRSYPNFSDKGFAIGTTDRRLASPETQSPSDFRHPASRRDAKGPLPRAVRRILASCNAAVGLCHLMQQTPWTQHVRHIAPRRLLSRQPQQSPGRGCQTHLIFQATG